MIKKDRLTAILMLMPSVILLAIFVYGFIGQTIYTSLTNWGMDPSQALAINPKVKFVGFAMYKELFTGFIDIRFRQDLVNTFFFTIFFIAGCLVLGLGLAFLLDQNLKAEGIYRTIFLLPMSLSFIVTGTIWRWLLQPKGGINMLPSLIGLEPMQSRWLTTREQIWKFNWQDIPQFTGWLIVLVLLWISFSAFRNKNKSRALVAFISLLAIAAWSAFIAPKILILPYPETHGFNIAFVGIIMAAVWQMSGYTMALYLAGLRGIPQALREAASVDGANEWQIYRHVVLPLLKPISLSAMIILGHISLKIFDLIFAMTGADNSTTDVPALLMYLTTFRANQFSKGAAIAVILLIMVAFVIIPYLWTSLRSEVER